MSRGYDWGIAKVDYEDLLDRAKKLNPPKITLLYVRTEIGIWNSESDTTLSSFDMIDTAVPWTFATRAQARHVMELERKLWRETKKVKIKVVKFKTIILEDKPND